MTVLFCFNPKIFLLSLLSTTLLDSSVITFFGMFNSNNKTDNMPHFYSSLMRSFPIIYLGRTIITYSSFISRSSMGAQVQKHWSGALSRGCRRRCACKGSWGNCRESMLVRAPGGRVEGNLVKALNHCKLENMKKLIEP